MTNLNLSDKLGARLRDRMGDGDVSEYVEQVLIEQLDFEDDPATQAKVKAQIDASLADIEAGCVTDARDAMRQIADKKGIKLDR